jgi:hypothetical protein
VVDVVVAGETAASLAVVGNQVKLDIGPASDAILFSGISVAALVSMSHVSRSCGTASVDCADSVCIASGTSALEGSASCLALVSRESAASSLWDVGGISGTSKPAVALSMMDGTLSARAFAAAIILSLDWSIMASSKGVSMLLLCCVETDVAAAPEVSERFSAGVEKIADFFLIGLTVLVLTFLDLLVCFDWADRMIFLELCFLWAWVAFTGFT